MNRTDAIRSILSVYDDQAEDRGASDAEADAIRATGTDALIALGVPIAEIIRIGQQWYTEAGK